MIACLYGRDFAPFVEPVARDLAAAAAAAGGEIQPLTLEAALADRARRADVHRLYVLPFDAPGDAVAAVLIRELFPHAEIAVSFAAQDLCWDKVATQERLLERGLPIPETLVTEAPADVLEFVLQHEFAILKERFSCGGQGHIVTWIEDGQLMGDTGSHRYVIDLAPEGRRALCGVRLTCPPPYYLQRLIAGIGARGVTPPQVLRAYVVDHQIAFWTERYRDRYTRPADWIVNASRGARYRFIFSASEEAKKIALRSVDVLGTRIGVVDLIRTGSEGPYVLDVDTDSHHMIIDRRFKAIPEYRDVFDLDRYIAEALLIEPPAIVRRTPPAS